MNIIENLYTEYFYRGFFESLFLFFIVLSLIKFTNIMQLISNNKNKSILKIIFLLILSAQVFDRFQYNYPQKNDFYPFTRYAMYQAAPQGVDLFSYRFCSYRTESTCNEINVAKIYSSIGLPSLSSRMHFLLNEKNQSEEIKIWTQSLINHIYYTDVLYITFEKKVLNHNSYIYEFEEIFRYEIEE